jgi:ribosomal protein S18 acetylase RimI-like enzyme
MNIEVIKANYLNTKHAKEIQELLNIYASDPMGGGKPLDKKVKENVVKELSKLPYAFSLIAYAEEKPIGLANCFESFSTFACKSLINIHDFVVLEECRGNGISQKMLTKIEEIAISKGCCKITLEILSNNESAKAAYKKFGFSNYELNPNAGVGLFWQKKITEDKLF